MAEKRARAEKGLGKGLQGMLRPIVVIQKKGHFGLGYKPDKRNRQKARRRKERKENGQFPREGKRKCKARNPTVELFFHLERFCQSQGNPMQG